jgi:hypothetical protein
MFITSNEVELENCDPVIFYQLWLHEVQKNSTKVGDAYQVKEADITSYNYSIDGRILLFSHYYPTDGFEIKLLLELMDDDSLTYQEVYREGDQVIYKTKQIFTFIVSRYFYLMQ